MSKCPAQCPEHSLVSTRERRGHSSRIVLPLDCCDHGIGTTNGHEQSNKQHESVEAPGGLLLQSASSVIGEVPKPKVHRHDDL